MKVIEVIEVKSKDKLARFLFPSEDYIIKTPLSAEEIIGRLNEVLEPAQAFRVFFVNPATMRYEGEIVGHKFRFRRTIGYRSPSRAYHAPFVSGEIEPDGEGSSVEVHLITGWAGAQFVFTWCIGLLLFLALLIANDSIAWLLPAFILTVHAINYMGAKGEASIDREFLVDLLAKRHHSEPARDGLAEGGSRPS